MLGTIPWLWRQWILDRRPRDAGGPLEFVTDGETGLVAASGPDCLWACPLPRLREMGEEGQRRVEDISWDRVVDRLTADLR
ncbi:MAG TPA: hypothetical protein VKI41_08105 [Vicinamibacteria bacterium]|nr:hypothetical protein [Vicinamibacteria bacterium]